MGIHHKINEIKSRNTTDKWHRQKLPSEFYGSFSGNSRQVSRGWICEEETGIEICNAVPLAKTEQHTVITLLIGASSGLGTTLWLQEKKNLRDSATLKHLPLNVVNTILLGVFRSLISCFFNLLYALSIKIVILSLLNRF